MLDSAINVFWAKGYEGASMDDLTAAMGIARPSLYATFGSKHELFLAAIDRHTATHRSLPFQAFQNEKDIRKAVAAFFETSIRCATWRGKPPGCLVANVATEAAQTDAVVREKISTMFVMTDAAIVGRLRADMTAQKIPGNQNPEALARMVVAVTHSIATRARLGAGRRELTDMADDFMSALFAPLG